MATPRKTKSLETIADEVKAESKVDTKSKMTSSRVRTSALAVAAKLSAETVAQEWSALSLTVGRTLNEAQQKVIEALQNLDHLEVAIKAKQAELDALYDKDIVSQELAAMVELHAQRKDEFARELKQLELANAEYEADLQKRRSRQEEEYEYMLAKERRTSDDAWRQDRTKRLQSLEDSETERVKVWAVREEAIASREKELTELRAAAAEFPETVRKQAASAASAAASATTRDLTQKHELEKKDLENKLILATQERKSAEDKTAVLELQIARLQAQLEMANNKALEIANSAFGSFSGQQALSALQNNGAAREAAVKKQ